MRTLRTTIHALMTWAAVQLVALAATGAPATLLAALAHGQFLTMSAAAAVALNKDGVAGAILLGSILFSGTREPFAVALALGAGLLLGMLLRTLLGGLHGQPVSDRTAGPGVRGTHGDARPDWRTSDPFGLDGTCRPRRGRPTGDGSHQDAAANR